MDNHESTAFTSVSSLIRSKPTQSIRSSREARDLYQALDQIFKDQREEEKQERFRPIDEDNGPSMLSCPPQSLPSPSSSEASQPTHGSLKRPISNDFLLPSSKTSCQSYKKTGQSDTFSHFLSSPSTPVTVRILFEAIGPSSKTIAEALIGEELKGAVTTQAEWITDIRMGTISNNRFTDLARRTSLNEGWLRSTDGGEVISTKGMLSKFWCANAAPGPRRAPSRNFSWSTKSKMPAISTKHFYMVSKC